MAYRRVGNIIGPTIERAEHIPQDPREKYYGVPDEYPASFVAQGINERNLAAAAAIAAKERAEPEEAIIDTQDVLRERRDQERIWGKDMAEFFQLFGKPAFRR